MLRAAALVELLMDDPMWVGQHAAIPLSEITIRASRSSGPGGQHANVTASRIEAVFDIDASATLNEEQKRRLRDRFGPQVIAIAQDARSQSRNRETALERLRDRLDSALEVAPPRRPTRPSKTSVIKRLTTKRSRGERKRQRQSPDAGDA